MKGKWFKKALGFGLVLGLTVGLCACGGGDGQENGGDGSGGNGNANAALAKENVYKLSEIELPQFVDEDNGYVSVQNVTCRDGRVYMILQIRDWSTNESEMKLLSMKEDGSDVQVAEMESSGTDQEDGGAAAEDGAEQEDGETAAEETVEASDVWDYTGYSYFIFASDGSGIYGVRSHSHEDYSNPDAYVSEQHTYLCSWDMTGALQWEVEPDILKQQDSAEEGSEVAEYIWLRDCIATQDGAFSLLLSGDNLYRADVSRDGEVAEKVQLSEETTTILNNYQSMMPKEDGTFLLMYSDENDWTKSYLAEYDFETDTVGEPSELPASLMWNGYSTMAAGKNSDLIYTNSTGVYTYNRGDAEAALKMNFVNSDVNITGFRGFVELDDESFIGIYEENYENAQKAALFTYVEPSQIADKAVLVLAGSWIGSDMRQRVIEYNRASDTYRIVLKEYDSYNSYEDYTAGTTHLNNDIITGGMPDILLADGLPVENYISKGLIADVSKLIAEDEELSQVEFMQNVFDAYSVDGKLYYVTPAFSVITMAAKTSLVGDGSDWSLEKMQQVLDDMGENVQPIGEVTRDGFMMMAMQYCGADFVDVETGKCAFDSDDFIAMMEFAKTLPEEIDWEELGDDYWSSYESQYRDNRTLLLQMYIGYFDNLSYQLNGYLGEPFTFVGFPTESGNGAYINASTQMVLSAKSDNLDGAWDFVRYYLTDEYQESLGWGLSVNRRIFMEQAQKATRRPTYTDYETGEEVEYDQTMYINGEDIAIEPLTQEQLDQVIAYIETVNTGYYYNEDVMNIINEEMGAFYSGQKSARDTAAIIQSRAQLYVDENR